MLRVRKRCVNWLHLAISWSGPCCPVFLGPYGGERGLLGPTWKGLPVKWKGSTGKWASLCRSRATGHAPRLPSSLCWGLFEVQSKDDLKERRSIKWHARSRDRGAAFLTFETQQLTADPFIFPFF